MNKASAKKFLLTVSVAMGVAAIWGYFSDLRQGKPGWFFLRLGVFTVAGVLAAWRDWRRGKRH